MDQVRDELMHYGVLGMKWGKSRVNSAVRKENNARESAKENYEIGRNKAKKLQAKGKDAKATAVQNRYKEAARKDLRDAEGLAQNVKQQKSMQKFREARADTNDSRSFGAKLATNLLGGPFANRTYGSVIAAGGTKTGARIVTGLTSVGGPLAHVVVSSLYTDSAAKKSTVKTY